MWSKVNPSSYRIIRGLCRYIWIGLIIFLLFRVMLRSRVSVLMCISPMHRIYLELHVIIYHIVHEVDLFIRPFRRPLGKKKSLAMLRAGKTCSHLFRSGLPPHSYLPWRPVSKAGALLKKRSLESGHPGNSRQLHVEA